MSPKTDSASSAEWYAVKALFRWYFKSNGKTVNVEERLVIFLAQSLDQALDLAEVEASAYCSEDETANYRIEPMGWWSAYCIGDKAIVPGTELYSRLVSTNLPSDSYLRRYYPKSHVRRTPI